MTLPHAAATGLRIKLRPDKPVGSKRYFAGLTYYKHQLELHKIRGINFEKVLLNCCEKNKPAVVHRGQSRALFLKYVFFAYFLFEKKAGNPAFLVLLLFPWKNVFFAYFLFEKKVGYSAFPVLLLFP